MSAIMDLERADDLRRWQECIAEAVAAGAHTLALDMLRHIETSTDFCRCRPSKTWAEEIRRLVTNQAAAEMTVWVHRRTAGNLVMFFSKPEWVQCEYVPAEREMVAHPKANISSASLFPDIKPGECKQYRLVPVEDAT